MSKFDRSISDRVRFKRFNKFLKGKNILDIGNNEGFVHKYLVKENPDKRFYTLDIEGNSDFVVDLNNPKKISKQFDTIIAGGVIEHLENPSAFVRYCKSLLAPNGRLIIDTANAVGIQYLRNPSWCVDERSYGGHILTFTMPMLQYIFKRSGMQVVHAEYNNSFWLNKNPLQLIPLIIPRLKTNLMIVGEKA